MEDNKPEKGEPGDKPKFGEEGYLYANKYKTVEEMEKSVAEFDKKVSQLGEGKAQSDRALLEATSVIGKLKGGDSEKEAKVSAEKRKARVAAFKDAFEKDPDSALGIIEGLVDDKLKGSGMLKAADYDAKIEDEKAAAATFTSIRNAHKEDFDALKPEMGKLWAKLPKNARVPEMLETVYLAAKASASPSLKEELAAKIRAGGTVAGKTVGPDDKRNKNDKDVDAIIDAFNKDKNF